jgi:hypothetical protein
LKSNCPRHYTPLLSEKKTAGIAVNFWPAVWVSDLHTD